ncbi:hypothetical protein HZB88_02330 [archaeon]|nr:hypothetical protein [archaeon]
MSRNSILNTESDLFELWNSSAINSRSEYARAINEQMNAKRLFYIKGGEKKTTGVALNVGFITPQTDTYITKNVRPAILSALYHCLPKLYQTSYARELLGPHTKFIDGHRNIFEKLSHVPAVIGVDSALYQDRLSLKVLEINMNAVISLGYLDPLVDIWNETFDFSRFNGHFRRMGEPLFKEMTNGKSQNIVILTIHDSKTYYEELNQRDVLQKYNHGKTLVRDISDLSFEENDVYVYENNEKIKVDVIKRAISGSIIARDDKIWSLLEEIPHKNVSLINPLEGLVLKGKIS